MDLTQLIVAFLNTRQASFSQDIDEETGDTRITFSYKGNKGKFECQCLIDEEVQRVVFYSTYPQLVKDNRMNLVAEFAHRANKGMFVGNFELNYDLGEFRYRTGIDVEGIELNDTAIESMIFQNVLTADAHTKAFLQIINKGANPQEVLEEMDEDASRSELEEEEE